MAGLRQSYRWAIALCFLSLGAELGIGAASAQAKSRQTYDRPVLTIDPGMHTSDIISVSADRNTQIIASGSLDKTIRIWNASTGALIKTVHPPLGPERVGELYATALTQDGSVLAVGGWTVDNLIYLIDPKTGIISDSISGMPNVITRLAFSPDGRYLVAGTVGLRVFDRNQHWKEVGHDDDFKDAVDGISFDKKGRFVASTQDGLIRLYDSKFQGIQSAYPYGKSMITSVAFNQEGSTIAVGSTKYPCVSLLDGHTLTTITSPKTSSVAGKMATVAWSYDGHMLFLSTELGASLEGVAGKIEACDNFGRGSCHEIGVPIDTTISAIIPTRQGGLLIAGRDTPYLGLYDNLTKLRWEHRSRTAEFPGHHTLKLNEDGSEVEFRFKPSPEVVTFSASTLTLSDQPPWDTAEYFLHDPVTVNNAGEVLVGTTPAPLHFSGEATSAAAFPNGDDLVVGTLSGLTSFSKTGIRHWNRPLENAVSDVRVSGNGKIIVAAVLDGTIRWFRAEDGAELLALMPLSKNVSTLHSIRDVNAATLDWIAWTPDGFYTSTEGATTVLQWLANQDEKLQAISVPVSDIPELHRPDVLKNIVKLRDADKAIAQAQRALIAQKIQIATGAQSPPGARLYVLSVGISDYGPQASRLNLKFADNDATEFLEKLEQTQAKPGGLYAAVEPMLYPNDLASKDNILQALNVIESQMRLGDNRDVMVLLFSGHGAKIDNQLFLLPYGVDAATSSKIESSAIPASQLQSKLASIAQHGFVLALLDACRSGSMTSDGSTVNPDASALQEMFSNDGIEILTSSSGTEDSLEDPKWKHGAFTKALLDELSDQTVNADISLGALASDLSRRLNELTGGAQHLGMSPDFSHLARIMFEAGH
jgi:WD40 repeat protein